MDRHPALIVVVEHGDQLQAATESFEILAQRRDPDIVGVLELGDRPLGDLQPPGQLGLADGLGMAQLVESEFLERLLPSSGDGLLGAGLGPRSSSRSLRQLVCPLI